MINVEQNEFDTIYLLKSFHRALYHNEMSQHYNIKSQIITFEGMNTV